MTAKERKAKVTPETLAESVRLRGIWDRTTDRPSQASFAETFGIGGQSAVTSFLNGKTPLSLKAAKGFALGLNCLVSDFSPRLAALESSWPFDLVDRERYEMLSQPMRHKAQVRLDDYITELLEEQDRKANGTHS